VCFPAAYKRQICHFHIYQPTCASYKNFTIGYRIWIVLCCQPKMTIQVCFSRLHLYLALHSYQLFRRHCLGKHPPDSCLLSLHLLLLDWPDSGRDTGKLDGPAAGRHRPGVFQSYISRSKQILPGNIQIALSLCVNALPSSHQQIWPAVFPLNKLLGATKIFKLI